MTLLQKRHTLGLWRRRGSSVHFKLLLLHAKPCHVSHYQKFCFVHLYIILRVRRKPVAIKKPIDKNYHPFKMFLSTSLLSNIRQDVFFSNIPNKWSLKKEGAFPSEKEKVCHLTVKKTNWELTHPFRSNLQPVCDHFASTLVVNVGVQNAICH